MAKLVFRLNQVSEEEADAVRQLLITHDIHFYETDAGFWGFSVAGLWVHNSEEALHARQLIDDYQLQRATSPSKPPATPYPIWFRLMLLILVVFILYVSLSPFLDLTATQ